MKHFKAKVGYTIKPTDETYHIAMYNILAEYKDEAIARAAHMFADDKEFQNYELVYVWID